MTLFDLVWQSIPVLSDLLYITKWRLVLTRFSCDFVDFVKILRQ